MRPRDKFFISAAPAFLAGPVVDQNKIPTSHNSRVRTSRISAPAGDPESATVNLDRDCIPPVESPQNRQRRASSVGPRQPSMKLISTTQQKCKPNRRNKSDDPPLIRMGLDDNAQCDSLPAACTAEAHFEDGVSMYCVRDARRPTKVSILRAAINHLSVYAFLHVAMIQPRHRAFVILTGMPCALQFGHDDFETFISDRCPRFIMIATAKDEATLFAHPGSQLYFSTLQRRNAQCLRCFRWKVSSFGPSLYLLDRTIRIMLGQEGKRAPVCAIEPILFHLMYHLQMLFISHSE